MTDRIELLFREVEKKLIKIITDMSYQKGRSEKFATIAAFSYVREKITQNTLRKLTGYSRGTISTTLQKLVDDKILDKEYDEKTRQFIYENKANLQTTLGGALTDIQDFFSLIFEKLVEIEKKLQSEEIKSKKGYDNLDEFIQEMKILMPAYQHVMEKYQLPNGN